jgi:nucleoside-diphosphate-sugar epimerase
MKNKIGSVLGCGWLGLPLAKKLVSDGFEIAGSKTSSTDFENLQSAGINPFIIDLTEEEIIGDFEQFLKSSSFLVIDIPPGLRNVSADKSNSFVKKIQNCIPFLEKSSVNHVVFISSTSVYSDSENYHEFITEETVPNPDTESGKQLIVIENLLLSNSHFKTTIIRFGGLIGPNRNPVTYLAGKQNLANLDAPINLIHQDDCIAIIQKIISQNDIENSIFNAVAPFHPSRQEYYQNKAKEENLEVLEFDVSKKSIGKTIDSSKLISDLKYTFLRPSL